MPPLTGPLFTLREESAQTSYQVRQGADRLRVAVSFDEEDEEEDTSDDPTAVDGRCVGAEEPVDDAVSVET